MHAHAVGVVYLGVHADAHHDVLHRSILAREVMEVVGSDDLDAHLLGDVDELPGKLLVGKASVGGDAVVLDLDVEVPRLKGIAEGFRPPDGLVELVAIDVLGNDARDACRGGDEPLAMAAQIVEGHTGLVVEALCCGLGDCLHEVHVASLVPGNEDHMVELGLAVARKRLVWGEIDLTAEDGLDDRIGLGALERTLGLPCGAVALPLGACLVVLGRLAEIPLGEGGLVVLPLLEIERGVVHRVARETELRDTVHVPMVGERHGGHTELDRAVDHVAHAGCAVEHGIFRMVVKVNEGHGASP